MGVALFIDAGAVSKLLDLVASIWTVEWRSFLRGFDWAVANVGLGRAQR